MFGRATIRLGIGPHSSCICFSCMLTDCILLWPPYVADADIIFLPCGFLYLLSIVFFISSPNLSRRRLDVYHTSTRGVALVRISDAGLKRAARGLLKVHDAKKSPKMRHLSTVAQLCRAISSQLRQVSTIGKKTC